LDRLSKLVFEVGIRFTMFCPEEWNHGGDAGLFEACSAGQLTDAMTE
jgi:hypothetical protein